MELAAARTRVLEPRPCWRGWNTAWPCCAGTPPTCRRATAPCAPPSTGATPCSRPEEQAVFRRLGVFAGGFTLEAAEAVAATEALGVESLEVLQGLVDKHLVHVLGSAEEEPRFGLLATVRGLCAEQLVESGERKRRAIDHLTHHLALAEQAQRAIWGPDEEHWLSRLDREVDNLRQAQEWAITRGDTEAEWRLVAALALFWVFRGYLQEGAERIEAALSRAYEADPALRARFLDGAGLIAQWSGDNQRAVALYEGSMAAAQDAGETDPAADVLGRLGAVAYAQGDATRARALFIDMLAVARAVNSRPMIEPGDPVPRPVRHRTARQQAGVGAAADGAGAPGDVAARGGVAP